jgi:hypothetical protein
VFRKKRRRQSRTGSPIMLIATGSPKEALFDLLRRVVLMSSW